MSKEISNSDDVIDSRDIIERIEELQDAKDEFILNESSTDDDNPSWGELSDAQNVTESKWDETDEGQELKALLSLQDELEGYCDDWKYGVTLIRDSYFQEYAQELAEDVCEMPRNISWPYTCIDWEQAARELQMDYTSAEFDGVTYWAR